MSFYLSLLGLLVVLHPASIPCAILYRRVHSAVSIRFLIVIFCTQEARFSRLFGLLIVSEFFFHSILMLLLTLILFRYRRCAL